MKERQNPYFTFALHADPLAREVYLQTYLLFFVMEGELTLHVDGVQIAARANNIV